MTAKGHQFKTRLEPEILERLQVAARNNGRSLNAEINALLDLAAPPPDMVKTQIRIPIDLHEKLVAAAKDRGRSLNSEMVNRLRITLPE